MCLGECTVLYFAVCAKIDGGTCYEHSQGDCGEHATVSWDRI